MLKWKKLDVKDLKKIHGGASLAEMLVLLSLTPAVNGLGSVLQNGSVPHPINVVEGMFHGIDGLTNAAIKQNT